MTPRLNFKLKLSSKLEGGGDLEQTVIERYYQLPVRCCTVTPGEMDWQGKGGEGERIETPTVPLSNEGDLVLRKVKGIGGEDRSRS